MQGKGATEKGNFVCLGQWASLILSLKGNWVKQECPWWASEPGGGQWRVGGALGGHYTDGSPQPLTNLDLVPVHVIIVMINTISDWILKAYFQVHIEANNFLF